MRAAVRRDCGEAEANQGHDMVRAVVHAVDPEVRVRKVYAHEGKRAR